MLDAVEVEVGVGTKFEALGIEARGAKARGDVGGGIFSSNMLRYVTKGMSVIPLHQSEKIPVPKDWSKYSTQLPSVEELDNWFNRFPNGNIGLVLGPQSRVCVIDIDTDNDELIEALKGVLPKSPWWRVGAKGGVLAFKYNGTPTFRIKDSGGKTIVEHLSKGTQVVLPPSIHPKTKAPYTSGGVCLSSVVDELPELPKDIESILRGFLKSRGIDLSTSGWTKITEWVPQGARDTKMTQVAGHYAAAVMKGERTLHEALELFKGWCSTQMETVLGDDIDTDKGQFNLIKFIHKDVFERKKSLPVGWDVGTSDEDKKKLGLAEINDTCEVWSYVRMREYLQREFEENLEGSTGREIAVDRILVELSKVPEVDPLAQDRILEYVRKAGGGNFKINSMKKQLKALNENSKEITGTNHTEIASLVIKLMERNGPIRYFGGSFYVWGGSHWVTEVAEPDETMIGVADRLMWLISEEFGSLQAARKHSDHKGILAVISNRLGKSLRTEDIKGVNFANGVVVPDGSLSKHDHKYGFTYTLPYQYKPEDASKCFKFQEFLRTCWGKDDDYQGKVDALQEVICATIMGSMWSRQQVILLKGAAQTGKSQLLRIVSALVPDNARCACPPDTWGDKFAPTLMFNKLLNVCGELSEHKMLDGQKFKDIIDSSEIMLQYKGLQVFTGSIKAAHWFASNHIPRSRDDSAGFTRRWKIFTFNRPIPPDEIIMEISEQIICEEREAIAAWAMQALPRVRDIDRPLTTTPSMVEETVIMGEYMNSVLAYLNRSGRVKVKGTSEFVTPEVSLYNSYVDYIRFGEGSVPSGIKQFRLKMRSFAVGMGFKIEERSDKDGLIYHVYVGIQLIK